MLAHILRVASGLMLTLACVVFGDAASYAADCVGPDDPPGCTPVASVSPSPAPSVSPDPAPSVTPDPAPSASAVVVVLDDGQYGPLLWGIGLIGCISIASLIGSWSK